MQQKIIVGISGASGIIYGIRLLEILQQLKIESHLVVSKAAQRTRDTETNLTAGELKQLSDVYYAVSDVGAAIASGSFQTQGMIIAPCSIKTLGEIAHGLSRNLLTRAADVTLKERRKLVLLVRETPYNVAHLTNMLQVTHMGAIVAPPVPAFYHKPETIDDIINQTIGRCLDLFGIQTDLVKRWAG